jgi:predicted N-formylglutamate amidohydrolase
MQHAPQSGRGTAAVPLQEAGSSDVALPLLGPDDPPPVEVVNPEGRARLIFISDHAGRAIPKALGTLGLGAEALAQHIAWDIGIAEVTRLVAARLDAPAVLANYSRLVIDCNRRLGEPTSICEVSDSIAIPGNLDLGAAARAARAEACFHPYHRDVAALVERRRAAGTVPGIISMHSFTPVMAGFKRPWHIGLLWNRDGRMRDRLFAIFAEDPALCVGDNEPYSGRAAQGYTITEHGERAGLPHILIELRQDLIDTPAGVAAWADRLAGVFARLAADDSLFAVAHF